MANLVRGRAIVAGTATGKTLVSNEPLSFWGGYDQNSGTIIDRRHPLAGQCAAHRILVLPHTRGSSTTTAVLLEAIRQGKAPAAIVTTGTDHFLALAAIVATEMYQKSLPIIAVDKADVAALQNEMTVHIGKSGDITLVGNV